MKQSVTQEQFNNTIAALDKSIAHWTVYAEGSLEEIRQEGYPGTENCPLCREFYDTADHKGRCKLCPVALKTGRIVCSGTPYSAAADKYPREFGSLPLFNRRAAVELQFLQDVKNWYLENYEVGATITEKEQNVQQA